MPDIAFEFDKVSAQVKDCEYVSNPYKSKAGGEDEDDDDDDEDEDEDDDGKGKPKLKLLQVSQLLCSFKKEA